MLSHLTRYRSRNLRSCSVFLFPLLRAPRCTGGQAWVYRNSRVCVRVCHVPCWKTWNLNRLLSVVMRARAIYLHANADCNWLELLNFLSVWLIIIPGLCKLDKLDWDQFASHLCIGSSLRVRSNRLLEGDTIALPLENIF